MAKQGFWERYERTAYFPFEKAATRYLREFDGKEARRQALALESVIPYIGKTPIIDINDGALEQFKHDRMNGLGAFSKKAMSGTVNKEITVVVTVLNRACRDWDWIPKVPRLRSVKGPSRVAYPITWAEQDRLFAALPTHWELGTALFAINTGVRKSELFGLKWSDLVPIPELDTFVFILRGTKNGQDRAVICNSIARRAVKYMAEWSVEAWPDAKDRTLFVFPSNHRGRKGKAIRSSGKVWSEAWKRAGLPSDPLVRRGIHNLRHTFGHRLRAAGVPEEDRAALLGHNNSSLVQHYAMPDIKRLSEMAERVTTRNDSIVLRSVMAA